MSTIRPDGAVWCRDFTPGYLDSPESDTLPIGATPDAKNAFLYSIMVEGARRAVMGRRPGSRMVTTTAIASEKRIDSLMEWRRGASDPTLLAVCDGTLYSVEPVTGVTAPIGPGFTSGRTARMTNFRTDAFVYDGTAQKRWDGTTLYDIGSAEPTAITNMAAGAGTLTGTYEAVYCWYNINRDHYSSPSLATATQALVAQGRTHTRPGSTIPNWATHWVAFVRRTDTNELNFFYTDRFPVGTASATETILDVVRQRGIVAPLPGANDAPPGAWKVLVEHNGFGIGILDGDDSYYASAIGDLEAWALRNKFPVSRSKGDFLSFAIGFGEELLIGTNHATWRLEGDEVPFIPRRVHESYGCVSQDAGREIDGRFFGWDRVHGPYVTDLVTWKRIGLHRIDEMLEMVNKSEVDDIRCVHAEKYGLVGWAIPTAGSGRRRTILWYHYELDCWLPPWTGLEYASFAEFTASGSLGVYMGDYWGRVYELFQGTKEGVPTESPTDNIRVAAVLSATASTVTPNLAVGEVLYTAGSGLAGLPVAVYQRTSKTWQWRRIKSNTSSQITLDTTNDAAWSTTPDEGYDVIIGGIEWFWWTPWIDFGIPHLEKRLDHLWTQVKSTSADHELGVRMRFNNDDGIVRSMDLHFDVQLTAGIWGVAIWGEALWAEVQRQIRKKRIQREPFSVQIQFSNYLPDQDIKIPMFGITTDVHQGKKAPSAATG